MAKLLIAVSLIGFTFAETEPIDGSVQSTIPAVTEATHSAWENSGSFDYELPPDDVEPSAGVSSLATVPLLGPAGDSIRTLRLAIATTGGYSAKFFGDATTDAQKRENVSNEIDRAVARLNEIYVAELGLRFELVPNNDDLIFLDAATDDYLDNNNSADNDINQVVVDRVIGTANYDIGHVFTATGGGNAILGGVGDSRYKAIGASGSSGSGTGDGFWMTVAHEIGHMLGARHTYALNNGTCDTSVAGLASAIEPGSGTTIMSYAGFCGSTNIVQKDNDPYFHAVSIAQMRAYMAGARFGNAGTLTPTSNAIPDVTISPPVSSVAIPPQTPFVLTASGTDADAGDALTYAWEHTDTVSSLSELIGLAVEPKPAPVPLFRSRLSSSPTRYFPALSTLLSNKTNQDALCSALGTLADRILCQSEYLPTTARTMDFRVTVRDGRGGVQSKNLDVVVTGSTPFSVTSLNSHTAYPTGSTQTITWNTAGTESWTPAFATVDIFTSVDGGATWTLALDGTANDGTEPLEMPATVTSQFRIKIQPEGAVFFDVSNADSSLYVAGTNGEPDAPLQVTATRGNSQATVSWTAPVSSGSSAVASYVVTSTPGGETCTTTSTSCVVMNLINGTSYVFTVQAVNDTAASAQSVQSQPVTPATRPDPPTDVRGVAGDGRVTVSWTAPVSDGGSPIIEYVAWSYPEDRWCIASQILSCTITGLTNGRSYTFSVYATNDVNDSYLSDDSLAVTPTSATTTTTAPTTTTTTTTTVAPSTSIASVTTTSAVTTTTAATTPVSPRATTPATTTPQTTIPVPSTTASPNVKPSASSQPPQSEVTATMFSVKNVSQLTSTQVTSISPSVLKKVSPSVIAAMTPEHIAVLTSSQIRVLHKSQIRVLRKSQIVALTPKQVAAFTPSQVSTLVSSQISSISVMSFKKLSKRQLKAISTRSVRGLTVSQIKTLNATEARILRLHRLLKKFPPAKRRAISRALSRAK